MKVPTLTSWPGSTCSDPYCMCAYLLEISSPSITWSITTVTPKAPPDSVAMRTVPSAIAWTGEPAPGTKSMRSEEHTSELQSLMRSSYAVFCLKHKNKHKGETG